MPKHSKARCRFAMAEGASIIRWKNQLPHVVAIGLFSTVFPVHAAIVQVGVDAFASDLPSGVQLIPNSDGIPATRVAVASRSVNTVAGDASSHAQAQADALVGTIKAKADAAVAANQYVIGRGSGATSIASMGGSILLAGPAAPGPATFTALLDGLYHVSTGLLPADNRVALHYEFEVGNSPRMQGDLLEFASGAFSIPFTWTQIVQSGDSIPFDFILRLDARALDGIADLDASNTFKVTGIDLPPGYVFTSDAQGFLSQFNSTPSAPSVPEPATWMLLLPGLAAAVVKRVRSRPLGLAGRLPASPC